MWFVNVFYVIRDNKQYSLELIQSCQSYGLQVVLSPRSRMTVSNIAHTTLHPGYQRSAMLSSNGSILYSAP